MRKYNVMVAANNHNGIGYKNRIPWHFPEDMGYFRKTTTDTNVIMGRNTYESIGKPLPNRNNIVVTSQNIPGVTVAPDLITAISLCDDREIFIIGGQQLYEECIEKYPNHLKKLYYTLVHDNHECDRFFPDKKYTSLPHKINIHPAKTQELSFVILHY